MKRLALVMLVFSGCGLVAWPGKACRKHDECTGLKEGYCARSEICTRACVTNVDCPEKSMCVGTGVRSVCLPTCEKDGDCTTGFQCGDGYCVLTQPLAQPN